MPHHNSWPRYKTGPRIDPGTFGLVGESSTSELNLFFRNFYGGRSKDWSSSKPHISRVVSKSDRDHGTATMDNRNLGLTPAGTISHSNLSLGLYPLLSIARIIRILLHY